ncbi:MAG: tetratricopeptide repeat protein, partial [Pseudomonadota bacterium]
GLADRIEEPVEARVVVVGLAGEREGALALDVDDLAHRFAAEEAFDLIEKAVELQPGSGAITDSLGWAYYQRGNYQEAVKHLELAASLEPSDPTITDHLGDVYWRLGRKIEAKYEWRRVLELDPPAKLKASVNKKIADGLVAVTPGAAGDDR